MQYREEEIGEIDHYYGQPKVAGIYVKHGHLKVGDRIHIKGHTTDMETEVTSMQVNHVDVNEAGIGAHVGVPVEDKVRMHDKVYIMH
ncbi:MAG: translation elongation factor-like protein [Deltaproteobacteria bacterium]|nr:translation elongation factor-like protein [Deltaproteobacteria bacterium]